MAKTIVEKHFDKIADRYDFFKKRHKFYYDSLKNLLSSLIPPNKKILEIGCATGDLIAFLKPIAGTGFDISNAMIKIAKKKHPDIKFTNRWPTGKFEYIFASDVVEHLENPTKTFTNVSKLMSKKSVFICTMANPLWEPLLMLGEKLNFKMPEGKHKRLKYDVIKKILKKSGLEIQRHDYNLLMPINIPLITFIFNKFLEKPFKRLAFIEYFTATKL